jgi:hypothetical protein
VQFQMCHDGAFSSTHFYPTRGGPQDFDIVIFANARDPYSLFLLEQKPGIRQFKFRGPIGPRFLSSFTRVPVPPLPVLYHGKHMNELVYGTRGALNNVVFIGSGDGIAPFIQLLTDTFLKTYSLVYCFIPYIPRESLDEMILEVGDALIVKEYFNDGIGLLLF